jgi:hypothetical protein
VTNGNGFDEDDKTIVTKGSTGINSWRIYRSQEKNKCKHYKYKLLHIAEELWYHPKRNELTALNDMN